MKAILPLLATWLFLSVVSPAETCRDVVRVVVTQLCKSPGLVAGQRVHRIEDDRLDAALRWMRQHVVEDRIK